MKLFIKIMKHPITLFLSIAAGFLLALYGKDIVPYIEPVNTIYLNLLQMCVLPIVSCAVAVNVGGLLNGKYKDLLKKWIAAVAVVLFLASGIAVGLSFAAKSYITPDEQTKEALVKLQGGEDDSAVFFTEVSYYNDGEAPDETEEGFTVVDFFVNAIPTNIFVAFVSNDTMKVLLFFALFGIMLGLIDEEKAGAVHRGMEGIYQAFCRLVDKILIFLPVGMCAMVAVQFSREGVAGIVVSLFKLIALIYLSLFVMILLSFCVIQKSAKCTLKEHIRAVKRSFFVAVGTSSCIATVSVAMDDVPEQLHLDKNAARSIMPIGITVFQSGVVMCAAVAAVFGTTIYHVDMNINTVLIILVGAIMYSFSIVGIPGIVAVSMLNIILSPLGIPSEMIVLIYLAIIPIIDPVSVFASVYSNIAITAVVVQKKKKRRRGKKLGKKLFAAIMGISITAVMIIGGAAFYQFEDTKELIVETKQEENDALYETNVTIMTDVTQESVRGLALSYAEGISGNIETIETSVRSLARNIEHLYEKEEEGVSGFADSMVYLQPGVSREEVEQEFMQVKETRDLIDSVARNFEKISATYYVSESGMLLSNVEVDYGASGGEEIDRRTRDWYTGAAKSGDVYWTEVYTDALSGKSALTCSCPVYGKNGALAGVVAHDIYLDSICEAIFTNSSDLFEYSFITDENGAWIVGDKKGDGWEIEDEVKAVLSAGEENGVEIYEDKRMVLGYAKIPVKDWNFFVLLNYDTITMPAQNVGEAIRESNNQFLAFIDLKTKRVISIFFVITIAVAAAVFIVTSGMTKSIVRPVEKLTDGVREISGGNLDYELGVEADGEIGELADAFRKMTVDLQDYIENLRQVTTEKERIGAELNVAANIQKAMLPCLFPAFPDRKEVDIYAAMTPAKEVGGDFYDFFMVDKSHLAIVMADVSGKGVPAALFMVIGKTLIKDHTNLHGDLGEVFTEVNRLLCEFNGEGLFITAFEGVLDLVTGEFKYVNAGHETPFICKKGDVFKPHQVNAGFVLAGIEDMDYEYGTLQLSPGDKIFQYTDGVTEATNEEQELYGMERLEEALVRHSGLPPKRLLEAVKEDVDAFVAEAPQFDDITMLCLEYREAMQADGKETGEEEEDWLDE